MKILNILFVELIIVALMLLIAIIIIDGLEEKDNEFGGFKDVTGAIQTGAMQSFEVFHEMPSHYNPTKKVSQRYDNKYFGYLEKICSKERLGGYNRSRFVSRKK